MPKTSKPWLRLAAEGAAILISILLAFAIDAWWEGHRERIREQEVLADLEAEFVRNQELLEDMEQGHRSRAEYAARILNAAQGDEPWPPADSINRVVFQALSLSAGSYDPQQGVFSAVSSSGELGLIRDDSLRYALAAWPGMLQDATEDEQWIIREVQNLIEPHLFALAPLQAPYSTEASMADLRSIPEIDYATLFQDQKLQNVLLAQIYNERFAADELNALDGVISEVLRLIRKGQR